MKLKTGLYLIISMAPREPQLGSQHADDVHPRKAIMLYIKYKMYPSVIRIQAKIFLKRLQVIVRRVSGSNYILH